MMSLANIDWIQLREIASERATSALGKECVVKWEPLTSKNLALEHTSEVVRAQAILAMIPRPFMESLDLFEPWHSRLKRQAVLKTMEIKDVRHFCLEVKALETGLKEARPNSLAEKVLGELMDTEETLFAIDSILTPRGEIRSDASEKLFHLFREKEQLERQIQGTLDRLVKEADMQSYLQDKYVTTREGRWVLPIKSGRSHFVPGLIHGSSQSKQTVFTEPEAIVPINNRLRQVEVDIEIEIERILTELSEYLAAQASQLALSKDLLFKMDCLFAWAEFSGQLGAKPIEFSEGEIDLKDLRHPLLVLAGKNPVANRVFFLPHKTILLLSGPNAGGKTVLMKSIGLAATMAKCGLPVCCAETSKIPFFETIFAAIGDAQSIGGELSTFAAHLQILQKSLQCKGRNQLVLVDEICGATDPEEGAALARAFIEGFAKNEIFAVITSHLSPLKTGWDEKSPVLNGSLEYEHKSGRPTYQFVQGVPGDSLALATAARVGVAADIVSRAQQFLSPEMRARLSGMEQIETMKADLRAMTEQLKKEADRALSEQKKWQELSRNLEKDKDKILEKTKRELEFQVHELIAQAKAEQVLNKHRALEQVKTKLPELVKFSHQGTVTQSTRPSSITDFAERFPPGSKVFVPSLQKDGIVQSIPNNKGEVIVMAGSIRLGVHWESLQIPETRQNPTSELVRRSGSQHSLTPIDRDRSVDLRGKTVEESLEMLERELDLCAERGEDRLKIIHGHGTEVLKKSVRAFLSRSMVVKKWKAGTPEQGGDGVTWVEVE